MLFAAALPALPLRAYIARYWSLRGDVAHEEGITLLPDGGANLVLNLGEGVSSQRYGVVRGDARTYLVGPMLCSDQQLLTGHQHLVGVSFRPGAFSCFYRWDPMAEAAHRVQGLDDGLSADAVRCSMSMGELARYLDRFYLDRFKPAHACIAGVLADIELHRGRVRIDELLKRHALTGRSLERYFAQHVGIGPKELVDVTRFTHALSAVQRAAGRHTLTRLAHDCGYYDGAHLTHAFKRFTGSPPSRFALSDLSKAAAAEIDTVRT